MRYYLKILVKVNETTMHHNMPKLAYFLPYFGKKLASPPNDIADDRLCPPQIEIEIVLHFHRQDLSQQYPLRKLLKRLMPNSWMNIFRKIYLMFSITQILVLLPLANIF